MIRLKASAPERPLLLIDAGNTRIKWAWIAGDGDALPAASDDTPWPHAGARPHDQLAELVEDWRDCHVGTGVAPPEVWISTVAGPALRDALCARIARVFDGARVRIVASEAAAVGLRNGYRDPAQLGTDRWVGAVGARHAWPDTALLLVTAGTATTLDIVAPDSLFAGGLILPGLTLMMRALSRNTAQLPEIDIGYLAARDAQAQTIVPPWADNTQDAIALGCVTAQAGAIAQTWQALQARYPGPARCVLSGGARAALGPHLRMPFQMHDNLVLLGLQVLAQADHEGRPGVATPT